MQASNSENPAARKKLAIVSTYGEDCGNASYTHVLRNAFAKHVDVDVLPLDLFLLQNTSPNVRFAGDSHIRDIAEKLKAYDYVNIQYEAGLYGASIKDMLRRIKILIEAAPNLILTLHRVEFENSSFWRAVKTGLAKRSYKGFRVARGSTQFSQLSRDIVKACVRAAKHKNVWIKVHTRRDRRAIEDIYGFRNAFDFPLAFLTEPERVAAQVPIDRAKFLQKWDFEPADKVIGLFGYLSNYKGIETAIEALAFLPPEYKLGLFGSQHPQSVKRGESINPYLESLFEVMEEVEDARIAKEKKLATIEWMQRRDRIRDDSIAADAVDNLRNRIDTRIKFVGSQPDGDFIEALRMCDVVVLPYHEVGQSMSGVVVLAMEAGARMVTTNNNSFRETKRYFKDCFHGFDQGNARELAQKIEYCVKNPEKSEFSAERAAAFERYNVVESINVQLKKFGLQEDQSKS